MQKITRSKSDRSRKRLYVLIRQDLESSYQAVQAGHAVAEWMLHCPTQAKEWNNGTLIYVRVKNKESLLQWSDKLAIKGYEHTMFHEPDIGNQATALACYCDGEVFKRLRLI